MLSSPDAELVRRDPAVPGLSVLLDARALGDRLGPWRPDISGSDLRNTYVRYKPGTNCLGAYRLQTPDGAVDLYAKAYGRDARAKFDKAAAAAERGLAAASRLVLRDAAMIIFMFPADARLTSLWHLGREEFRRRLIQKLLPDHPPLWEGMLQRLQYKPERRYVARLSHEDCAAAAVLKFYSPSTYKTTNLKGFQSGTILRVPKRLGRSNEHRVLSFEWLAGQSLGEQMLTSDVDERLDEVGVALAEFHRQHGKRLIIRTPATEVLHLNRLADAIGRLWPPLADRARELAARLSEALRRTASERCTIHGDFHPKQVVLMDQGVGMLDLDEAAWGDPASDLGNLVAHLDRGTLRGHLSSQQAERFQARFLAGYQRKLPTNGEPWQIHAAAALFRLAMDPFRYREPEWPQRIEGVLQRAERRLESGWEAHPRRFKRHPKVRQAEATGAARDVPSLCVHQDPQLAFVGPALDPGQMQNLLERWIVHPLLAGGRVSATAIRVMRHKPGRRCLIEYHVQAARPDRTETVTLIGKARAKGLDRATLALQQSLWTSGFDASSDDGISVPEPIGAVPELHLWLQRSVPGVSAWKRLLKSDGPAVAARIADAILKLHQAGIPPRRRHTMADELAILRDRLRNVAENEPRWRKRLERVYAVCAEHAESIPAGRLCGIHRDFYHDQVLIAGSRIYLLDLDLYCEGDPALDIGNFNAHLIEQSLRRFGESAALEGCCRALERRYLERSQTVAPEAISTYTLLALARHISVSRQFVERRRFTESLLVLCERLLAI